MINKLLGKKNWNPLPPATDYRHLAEELADYFLNTIDKIREQFTGIQPYQPRLLDTTPLSNFASITTSQLRKIINSMPSKTCPLDTLQMDRLKQVLEGFLPAITHIINRSLDSSEFLLSMEGSTS